MGRLAPGVSASAGPPPRPASSTAGCGRRRRRRCPSDPPTSSGASWSRPLLFEPGARGRGDLRSQFGTELVVLMGMVGLVLLVACANVANLLGARALSAPEGDRGAPGHRRLAGSPGGDSSSPRDWSWPCSAARQASRSPTGGRAPSSPPCRSAPGLARLQRRRPTRGSSPSPSASTLALQPPLRARAGAPGEPGVARADAPRGGGQPRRGAGRAAAAPGPGGGRGGALPAPPGRGRPLRRSLHNLRRLDPGFDPRPLVTFSVEPARAGYSTEETQRLVARLREELAALPGVVSATAAENAILDQLRLVLDDHRPGLHARAGRARGRGAELRGPRLLRDAPGARCSAAGRSTSGTGRERRTWPSSTSRWRSASSGPGTRVGRRFGFGRRGQRRPRSRWWASCATGATRACGTGSRSWPTCPRPAHRRHRGGHLLPPGGGDPAAQGGAAREAVRRVDPALPVNDVATMSAVVDESLLLDRLSSWLSAAFGLLATALAAIGLYAVTSFSVARRTREIGLRMALGADVRVGAGPRPAGRAVRRRSSGSRSACRWRWRSESCSSRGSSACARPTPLTLSAATIALLLVVLLAGYVPARRATRVDPMIALRVE